MAAKPVPAPEGDPKRVAALLETEARLEVTFPASYRAFVAQPRGHTMGVKRVRFFPVQRCEWLESGDWVVVGEDWNGDGLALLVFKLRRGRKPRSDTLYALRYGRMKRLPPFADFVHRERHNPQVSRDEQLLWAQRMTGVARTCSRCGTEIRIGQACTCGRIGDRSDPGYEMSDEDRQAAAEVATAWAILRGIADGGERVPLGPAQVVLLATILVEYDDPNAIADALLDAWEARKTRTTVSRETLAAAVTAYTDAANGLDQPPIR